MAFHTGAGAAAAPETAADSHEEHNRWQIPIKHNVFEILKSKESQLCEVLQNKFGCVSTLSCPALAGNSSPAQQVFRKRLTPSIELSVWKDDLTRHVVDAVVNAANEDLWHGGGLAGSLVKAGGLEIQTESTKLVNNYGKVPTGAIAVTNAGRLPCRWIIHAVGPRWTADSPLKAIGLLKFAIWSILDYVTKNNTHIKTVAIPALSSGIFQFPLDLCTSTILETIQLYFQGNQTTSDLKEIHLVSNESPTVAAFKYASESILGKEPGLWEIPETTPSSQVTLQIGQGLTLQIVQGHIQMQTTDVIVNSTNKYNLKSGCVSKSILKQAGLEMEWELGKFSWSADNEVVRVTKGFKLSCQYVFHVLWQPNSKYQVFCAEMTKRSSELSLSMNSAVPVSQWTRGEQSRSGLEAGSPAISLMGVNSGEMCEAKEWIERLLTSEAHHIIENNHILYLGKKEHDTLSQLQKTARVSISETVSPEKAALEIRGAQADLIEAVMSIESMLCQVQEEVVRKKEKSLLSLSGQQGKLDEMEELCTYLRYPVSLTWELEDRKKQFEKYGLWVVKVEQTHNKALLAAFQEKKKMMEERAPRGSGSQRLFQQVPHQFCDAVCRVGFHRLYSAPCDRVYGAGIYFTKSLRKLADTVKKTSSADKLIYVFEAEVLTGSFCQGNYSNIVPSPLSPGALDAHDSVVDSVSNPETIVVFSGTQAMPQYLWTCTQDRTLSEHQMWLQDCSPGPDMDSSLHSWVKVSNGSPV
ncbi:protein mono-ADP-ribosyltransferase PARP9 isoform X2 [Psammomys obesus]|uniref:protein mono-ADP-ribosyltransferase PARP9 isoform X2 n=1 Tax=Psammomys obesus TaxID=48139 RepID=UPI00245289AC|nr:protein mono-ADP-ribosyltransferase PARP9 isoform X2 [Psammomys obesus]